MFYLRFVFLCLEFGSFRFREQGTRGTWGHGHQGEDEDEGKRGTEIGMGVASYYSSFSFLVVPLIICMLLMLQNVDIRKINKWSFRTSD